VKDILSTMSAIHHQLFLVNTKLWGHGCDRPYRDPYNQVKYDMWYNNQTDEIKEAEAQLYAKGYYKYEGVDEMFDIKSKEGQQLHVDDVVKVGEQECIIMSIISPRDVQVNPVGPGLPFITPPETITVLHSFIEKIIAMKSDEELQAILSRAEQLSIEMGTKPAKLVKTKSTTEVKPAEPELDF